VAELEPAEDDADDEYEVLAEAPLPPLLALD
jgi:hypothetical protein